MWQPILRQGSIPDVVTDPSLVFLDRPSKSLVPMLSIYGRELFSSVRCLKQQTQEQEDGAIAFATCNEQHKGWRRGEISNTINERSTHTAYGLNQKGDRHA